MSQVIFSTLNVVGREKPLLLEDTVKEFAAFADLEDFSFDNAYTGSASGWSLDAGVTVSTSGGGGGSGIAVYDDGISTYDSGVIYG